MLWSFVAGISQIIALKIASVTFSEASSGSLSCDFIDSPLNAIFYCVTAI